MIKAVIFDMDGVIVDSERLHFEADKLALEGYGVEIADDTLKSYAGVKDVTMWKELKEIYNLDYSVDELTERQIQYKLKVFGEKDLKPIDGIPELIGLLKEKAFKIGLASSSRIELIRLVLDKLGIAGFFDVIVSGEDVANSKPAPDIFLRASELLGVAPGDCLVIEDTGHGVKAAKSAGMKCIGYINANSGKQDLSMADLTVSSIRDVDVDIF
ncbi:MAG: HAD family hydrolase [Bacillota bacterium]